MLGIPGSSSSCGPAGSFLAVFLSSLRQELGRSHTWHRLLQGACTFSMSCAEPVLFFGMLHALGSSAHAAECHCRAFGHAGCAEQRQWQLASRAASICMSCCIKFKYPYKTATVSIAAVHVGSWEDWCQVWLQPLVDALCAADEQSRASVATYAVPAVLSADAAALQALLDHLLLPDCSSPHQVGCHPHRACLLAICDTLSCMLQSIKA